MQDHNEFEVVWLSEIKYITKVRSKQLQDVKGNAVKAKFVAERDDAFASTPPIAVARTQLALAANRNQKGARCIRLFDVTAASVHSPITKTHSPRSAGWDCPATPGTLVARFFRGRISGWVWQSRNNAT